MTVNDPAGVIIAAPASGSGKTLVTLGLLAALKARGHHVASAKTGPDYIDPAFHAAALGQPGITLDSWAMEPGRLGALIAQAGTSSLMVCEGVMGLLDGADVEDSADGSTAHLAQLTGWPVILVVDARGMAASAAAVVRGFASVRPGVTVAGVLFNRAGGARHADMIGRAMASLCPDIAVLGYLPALADLAVPSRHLGLVQACEHPDLANLVARAGAWVAAYVDLDRLVALARVSRLGRAVGGGRDHPVPGGRIALARDAAFAFVYEHHLTDWRRQGAEIIPFSPLDGQAPDADCDAVLLPGGYPELHAPQLAAASGFLAGLRQAAARGATIHGECGGYMVLGQTIVDASGCAHAMAGLLPVVTSIEHPVRHLGYRRARLMRDHWLSLAGGELRGHEFHFTREVSNQADSLFALSDASGRLLCNAGSVSGAVSGSFIHLI